MRKKLFAALEESVREGGAILRGEQAPSRVFSFEKESVRASAMQFVGVLSGDDPDRSGVEPDQLREDLVGQLANLGIGLRRLSKARRREGKDC